VNNFYERLAHCQTVEERHFKHLIEKMETNILKSMSLTHAHKRGPNPSMQSSRGASRLDNANADSSVTFKPHNSKFI